MAHHQSRSTAQMEAQPCNFRRNFQPGRRSCPRRRLSLSTAVIYNCPYPDASWRRYGWTGLGPSWAIPIPNHHAQPGRQQGPSIFTCTTTASLDPGNVADVHRRTATHANRRKLWNLPLIPIQPGLTALPQQLSVTTERKPGRTASSASRGFSHCYPDPRFDMPGSCGNCPSRGIPPGSPRHWCCGTGNAPLRPSDEPTSRLSGRLA